MKLSRFALPFLTISISVIACGGTNSGTDPRGEAVSGSEPPTGQVSQALNGVLWDIRVTWVCVAGGIGGIESAGIWQAEYFVKNITTNQVFIGMNAARISAMVGFDITAGAATVVSGEAGAAACGVAAGGAAGPGIATGVVLPAVAIAGSLYVVYLTVDLFTQLGRYTFEKITSPGPPGAGCEGVAPPNSVCCVALQQFVARLPSGAKCSQSCTAACPSTQCGTNWNPPGVTYDTCL